MELCGQKMTRKQSDFTHKKHPDMRREISSLQCFCKPVLTEIMNFFGFLLEYLDYFRTLTVHPSILTFILSEVQFQTMFSNSKQKMKILKQDRVQMYVHWCWVTWPAVFISNAIHYDASH